MSTQRKAFLTGGTGFVGTNVAKELTEQGWDVTALHRTSSDVTYLSRFPVTLAEGSIRDIESLRAAIPDGTDTIFHVAGDTNIWRPNNEAQFENNVTGTANIRDVAIEKGVRRLVVTSSTAAWGDVQGELIETRPMEGKDSVVNYYKTKHLGELEAKKGIERGLEVVVMNPAAILGPFDRGTWARIFFMAKAGTPMPVMPGTVSCAHVTEVARAHVTAADKGRNGENYILGGDNREWKEVMAEIFTLMGKKPPSISLPMPVLRGIAATMDGVSRLTRKEPPFTPDAISMMSKPTFTHAQKAQDELGFQVIPMPQMVKDSYDWLKAENLL